MKNSLFAAIVLTGVVSDSARANGIKLANELEQKRFREELSKVVHAQRAEAPTGNDPWDNYSTPLSASIHEAGMYQVLSMPSFPIPQVYMPATVTASPASLKVEVGTSVTLRVSAAGTGVLHYQWRKNGELISGANLSTLSFVASNTTAGSYDCIVSNTGGTDISDAATVTIAPPIDGKLLGTFTGLIERDVTLNRNLASTIQLTITKTGAYTGRIVTGTTSIALSGRWSVVAGETTKGTLTQVVSQLGATLNLTIDASTNSFTGTLQKLNSPAVAINGWRNTWAEVVGNAAKYKGLHSFVLQPTESGSGIPSGYGFGSLTVVEKTGALTYTGYLADGTAIIGSTFVGPNGEVLVYSPAYANLGSLIGTLQIVPGQSAPTDNTIEGTTTWLKPANRDNVYKAGFGPITLDVAGSYYVPVAKGARILQLPFGTNNAQLVFSGGGLDTEGKEFKQTFTINNPNPLGTLNTAVFLPNSNKVTMPVLNTSTGAFSGDFTLATSVRKALFRGQIVTISGTPKGYGYFVLPKAPVAGETISTSPRLSGSVLLEKAQ